MEYLFGGISNCTKGANGTLGQTNTSDPRVASYGTSRCPQIYGVTEFALSLGVAARRMSIKAANFCLSNSIGVEFLHNI